jgi:uncharacterized protein YdhG (YjbR/CyaY superfamily)
VPAKHTDVDGYLATFDEPRRAALEELRGLIHECLPGSGEKISYEIPTVTLSDRPVLYYAGWKRHLSLYPVPRGDEVFELDVAPYRAAKDAVHLPYDQPLPRELVTRIVALLHERYARSTG